MTTPPITPHLFDTFNIYADIATNHGGNEDTYMELLDQIDRAGVIPKIQLFSDATFPRTWPLPPRYVPSVFKPSDVEWCMNQPWLPLALKVASVESTYWDLITACMQTNLPLIVSTGGMTLAEVFDLLDLVEPYDDNVCLMHCVSEYPTPTDHACMTRITMLADAMEDALMTPLVGWSSHHNTDVWALFITAMSYGATQFEFHTRLSSDMDTTPDAQCALLPTTLGMLSDCYGRLIRALPDTPDEHYVPTDRAAVLDWRKRWQEGGME